MRPRNGWVMLDIVTAIILITFIAAMLAAGSHWQQRAILHLADSRAATRIAESALLDLQSGQPVNISPILRIRRLTTPSNLPGQSWVEIDAASNGRWSSLIGLVPDHSLLGGS